MYATKLPPSYDSLLDFLVKKATPEEILAFELTPQQIKQAEELGEKSKVGHLSDDEAYQLEKMMQAELLIGALRARALVMLKNNGKSI